MSIKQRRQVSAVLSVVAATSALMAGCSSAPSAPSILGEKVDYRTAGAKVVNLDVPPDLSKLPGQSRYGQVSPAIVSANSLNTPASAAQTDTTVVAPGQFGNVKLERQGQLRWLSVSVPPEQIWDQVRSFWTDAGFELVVDQPAAGLMETNWAENRAKLPQDIVRRTLGSVMDGLYDTGERDQYKTRIERTAKGAEIYVTHRGVSEEYANSQKDQTRWQPRVDAALEAEVLSRLMLRLGSTPEAAAQAKAEIKQPVAAAPTGTANTAVRLTDQSTALAVDDDFDTVWRRVGLALDRAGYTIENRDRANGIYEVRLPGETGDKPKPGFWARLFHSGESTAPVVKHQIRVQGSGNQTSIKVTDQNGQTQTGPVAQRIAKDLLNELM
ncbi:MAG: outer membrane protein assembly factor BamC [Acidobacteriota bacterium]